jgi:hypothetical protein
MEGGPVSSSVQQVVGSLAARGLTFGVSSLPAHPVQSVVHHPRLLQQQACVVEGLQQLLVGNRMAILHKARAAALPYLF